MMRSETGKENYTGRSPRATRSLVHAVQLLWLDLRVLRHLFPLVDLCAHRSGVLVERAADRLGARGEQRFGVLRVADGGDEREVQFLRDGPGYARGADESEGTAHDEAGQPRLDHRRNVLREARALLAGLRDHAQP